MALAIILPMLFLFIILLFASIIMLSATKGTYDEKIPYFSLVKHCFVWFFTLGIYFYVWIFNTTKSINYMCPMETRNATTEVLLCLFIPCYYIFWIYKTTICIDRWSKNNGCKEKISTICTIISIINPFVASTIIQDKLNGISNNLIGEKNL